MFVAGKHLSFGLDQQRHMGVHDIGRAVGVSEPRVSPDGGAVSYVVTSTDLEANEYRSRVWLSWSDASRAGVPLTAGTQRDRLPRWSPDSSALAFVSHRDGVTGSELYVHAGYHMPVGGEVGPFFDRILDFLERNGAFS